MKLKWFFIPAFLVIASVLAFLVIVYYNVSQLIAAVNVKRTEPARAARWKEDSENDLKNDTDEERKA